MLRYNEKKLKNINEFKFKYFESVKDDGTLTIKKLLITTKNSVNILIAYHFEKPRIVNTFKTPDPINLLWFAFQGGILSITSYEPIINCVLYYCSLCITSKKAKVAKLTKKTIEKGKLKFLVIKLFYIFNLYLWWYYQLF